MLSGRSTAKLVINNPKKYSAPLGSRAACRAEPQFLPQGQPELLPILTAQPCTPLFIASSPGERGLDWSLRDWAKVCLQTELSIRIQTHRGRERAIGASAGGEFLWETCSNYEKSHFPMLGIRSECNGPSRLETWLRAQKARWPVRQHLNAYPPTPGPWRSNLDCGVNLLRLMEKCFPLFPRAWRLLITRGGRGASADSPICSWPRVCSCPVITLAGSLGWEGGVSRGQWMTPDSWVSQECLHTSWPHLR